MYDLHTIIAEARFAQVLELPLVILVDAGMATGNTLLATVELVSKQKPAKILVAIPVAPGSGIRKLENNAKVDETICLYVPYNFQAVGQFYEEFHQVTDEEAIQLLEETNAPNPT